MNRIDKTLARLKQTNKKMLSPYITAGDLTLAATLDIMHALVDGGADLIELGIPFSDPMAEGLVIQEAMERALLQGVNCDDVFTLVATFRERDPDTPIILMGYVNPVEIYGYERFAARAEQVGVDGTILVDLPPEESQAVMPIWKAHGLYNIYLCSPTTSSERMVLINKYAQGYLYYVSLKGVTGSNDFNVDEVRVQYQQRKLKTSLPLMVGFGIKTPEMAASIASFADGVIVGAALISTLYETFRAHGNIAQQAMSFLGDMRQAMDQLMEKK